MKRVCFNNDWEFTLEADLDAFNAFGLRKCGDALGGAERFYEYNNWEKIDLPHDWAIGLPKELTSDTNLGGRTHTHYHSLTTENRSESSQFYNVGWYRKSFAFDEEWNNKRIFVEFEGIFRDAMLWVNGVYIDRHFSGYTSFLTEITDQLVPNEMNSIAVRVDSDQPEGWWYEGAGIYRNVNLLIGESVYFKPYETFIKSTIDGNVHASAEIVNDSAENITLSPEWEIWFEDEKLLTVTGETVTVRPYESASVECSMHINNPRLWDINSPNLYRLCIKAIDQIEEVFGIRSVRLDADEGFFLNGKPLKIHGACVHQDLGGVGTALTDNLQYYKIKRLKEMGVNAYRTAHHAPSPALLRACDELGMLVMDETRMFGASAEALRQLTDLIKRDRNHPSVFIWSIGNEENAIQRSEWGKCMAQKAVRVAHALDDTRLCTYGGNDGVCYDGINSAVPVRGINYIRIMKLWGADNYHKDHPTQPMIATEESSYLVSRSGTANNLGSGTLSYIGDATMPWGSTPEGWVKFFESRPWLAGGFMWTGFDYGGEPAPFLGNVSSSFGAIDYSGIEKPVFWYYKAWWTDEPVLKLSPHWNFNDGETVKVSAYTNCEEVTLFLNGKMISSKKVDRFECPRWDVTFEAGELSVEGKKNGQIYRDTLVTSGVLHHIDITPILHGDDKTDISIYQIEARDVHNRLCTGASDTVEIKIQNGTIVGVCNGDPSYLGYDQKPYEEEVRYIRTLDSERGYCQVPPLKAANAYSAHPWRVEDRSTLCYEEKSDSFDDLHRLVVYSNKKNNNYKKTYMYTTEIFDAERFEYIEFERIYGDTVVYLNGAEIGNNLKGASKNNRPYRFYASFSKGKNELKIVSTLKDGTEGAVAGYIKLGRNLNSPWQIDLYGGIARVFIRAEGELSLKACLK